MSSWRTPSLTEEEIKSVYRNEFFRIDNPRYFKNPHCWKKTVNKNRRNEMDKFYGKIKLNSIADVKSFANAANEVPCEVEVSSSRYIVDGKSILGLFSLDLSKDVMLRVNKEYIDKFEEWVDE